MNEITAQLVGQWTGDNRLWFSPDDPAIESPTTATVGFISRDQFLEIRYSWRFEDQAQDGLLALRLGEGDAPVDAFWLDSFHTGGGFMAFKRAPDPSALVSVLGSYPAPEGPDWGWRIALHADGPDAWRLVMYNIMPGEPEMLAVEARYERHDSVQGLAAAAR